MSAQDSSKRKAFQKTLIDYLSLVALSLSKLINIEKKENIFIYIIYHLLIIQVMLKL